MHTCQQHARCHTTRLKRKTAKHAGYHRVQQRESPRIQGAGQTRVQGCLTPHPHADACSWSASKSCICGCICCCARISAIALTPRCDTNLVISPRVMRFCATPPVAYLSTATCIQTHTHTRQTDAHVETASYFCWPAAQPPTAIHNRACQAKPDNQPWPSFLPAPCGPPRSQHY